MGYAVDYRPTRKRAKRQVPQNREQRKRDIRNAVKWNLGRLEHDTTGTDSVSRSMVCLLLRLGKVAPAADPTGDHLLQQLISEGVLNRPTRRAGEQVFDRADLLASLKAWVGRA
ncbi:hypothetical protein [Bifidobacterium cebidarum]|uniref:Uncharacterized protein n=1 Tax=Bifidobacterium cebidarum TaxID=2650773 RepID=A0A6I1GCT7_9BIFI|nr:hypothetical protein [Bifidobacterium cebidarum]KAB7789450.1 hypothetical protein F7D08_0402 [Bifidobacterium cebidarum]